MFDTLLMEIGVLVVVPPCRFGHSAVIAGNFMYIWGGFDEFFDISSDVGVYRYNLSSLVLTSGGSALSIATNGWSYISATSTVRPSAAHAAVTNGVDLMWVYGGYSRRRTSGGLLLWWATSQLLRYNITANTWTNIIDTATAAGFPLSATYGNNLTNAYCATWASDSNLTPIVPPVHCVSYPGLVISGNTIYHFAGNEQYNFNGETSYSEFYDNALYSYSITSNTWTTIHTYACDDSKKPECRYGFVMTLRPPSSLIVFGGERVPYFGTRDEAALTNSMWEFNVAVGNWSLVSPESADCIVNYKANATELRPSCLTASAAAQLNQTFVLFGGESVGPGQSQFSNSLMAYRRVPKIRNTNTFTRATPGNTTLGMCPVFLVAFLLRLDAGCQALPCDLTDLCGALRSDQRLLLRFARIGYVGLHFGPLLCFLYRTRTLYRRRIHHWSFQHRHRGSLRL